MKKIIVPVDFTKYSENAIKIASFFAKKFNSEIVLVHMLELSGALISQSEKYNTEKRIFDLQLTRKKFEEILVKDYLSEIRVSVVVKDHKSFVDLTKTAKEKEVDLIVMATHGASGLKEVLKGSNTEKVVRNSEIPVLVIKGLPVTQMFEKAVFACDFSDEFINPYKKTKALLALFDCRLELLYVNTPGENFITTSCKKEKIINFLIEADGDLKNFENVVYVSEYTIEEGILTYASSENNDLIVMPTHGKTGINHLLSGSIAEDVANHTELPVLTVRV